jgi:F-type H+-transporting ATPase subunit delta
LSRTAQRYASALADVVTAHNDAAAASQSLATFVAAYESSPELRNVLASPAVAKAAKQAVIERVGAFIGLHPGIRNFLFVIADNRRMGMLSEVWQNFQAELNRRLGIAEAEVTSAHELHEQEKLDLVKTLEQVTGKRVEARYQFDPELIGGAVVRIGSTVYDGSVREQLNRMRTRLEAEQ